MNNDPPSAAEWGLSSHVDDGRRGAPSQNPGLASTPLHCAAPADPFLGMLLSGASQAGLSSRPPADLPVLLRTWTIALHHARACQCRSLAPGRAAQLRAARAGLHGSCGGSACAPTLQLSPARHSCG